MSFLLDVNVLIARIDPRRIAQRILMAAASEDRRKRDEALRLAVQEMSELERSDRRDLVEAFAKYVLQTQDRRTASRFDAELQRQVPGSGGDMRTYAEELLQEGLQRGRQEGRQEGRQKGRQEGQLDTIAGFLRAGVAWPVIEVATGIDEEAFQALRQRLEESDRTTG